MVVMIRHVKIILYCKFIILSCLKYAVLWLWNNTTQKYTNAVRQIKIRVRSLMQPESMRCQTNENSHRIAGAALIYALNSWRHSVRAAVRLSLKLSRE